MSKLKVKIHEASKKPAKKITTLTPEEISAIESACNKYGLKYKVGSDSTVVAIWESGEEVRITPYDDFNEGLTVKVAPWAYGGMDSYANWATPELTLNCVYSSYSSNDISVIVDKIFKNLVGLLKARSDTLDFMHGMEQSRSF